MTTPRNDGGPAFPTNGPDNGVYGAGMPLRDYLAAKAMQGLLGAPSVLKTTEGADEIAEAAYEIADAMLVAREAS